MDYDTSLRIWNKASNLGRIKSFKKNKIDGEILEFKPNKYGDLYGIFYDNKKPQIELIKEIIAELFIPKNCEAIKVINIDNNILNNHVSNLKWVDLYPNKEEIWVNIKNYEGLYKVSNLGNIKSFSKKMYGDNLIPAPNKNKELRVTLINSRNNLREQAFVKNIVANHFVEKTKNFEYVKVKNGNENDCRAVNLEWYGELEPLQLPNEIWKFIPNMNEKYQISNFGRIKSLNYDANNITQKILQLGLSGPKNGNRKVFRTCFNNNSKNKSYLIHRLVAELFVENPKPNEYDTVHHIDNNYLNNHYNNLLWTTSSHNTYLAHKDGRFPHPKGLKNKQSMFTADQIKQIRAMYIPRKFGSPTIARIFNTNSCTIQRIIKRESYQDVP